MFIARFMLGLGIGPKSATVPIYAAECTPPGVRGALVMQVSMHTPADYDLWQLLQEQIKLYES